AISPDGRLLAAGIDNLSIGIWNLDTGEKLHDLIRHDDRLRDVYFSPDGRLLASASWDRTVRLWDVASGEMIQTLRHGLGVNKIQFSPDGGQIAAGLLGGDIVIRDIRGDEPISIDLIGHRGDISSIAYSPDGRLLVSGSRDREMRIWNAQSGELLNTLEGHEGILTRVAVSADGSLLASGDQTGVVRIWGIYAPNTCVLTVLSEINLRTGAGERFAEGRPVIEGLTIRAIGVQSDDSGNRWWQTSSGEWIPERLAAFSESCLPEIDGSSDDGLELVP
ncbi:MAG TPA: WD40 repeat domain-containing protein, partial [Aggregatilineales bacterium]|nr:WD40 repeat domain-containing protein [Aggregatilineales bacterium]